MLAWMLCCEAQPGGSDITAQDKSPCPRRGFRGLVLLVFLEGKQRALEPLACVLVFGALIAGLWKDLLFCCS